MLTLSRVSFAATTHKNAEVYAAYYFPPKLCFAVYPFNYDCGASFQLD